MNNNSIDETKEARKIAGVAVSAAENLGREIKSGASKVGCAIKDASIAVGNDVGAVAQDTYDSVVASGREGAKQLESRVQQSPLMAIGIAFGVGLLASSIFFRKPV